jgi:hypothetical protein
MFYMFAALQRVAAQRRDGLLPELADRLRKMPRLGDGYLTTIDGDASDNKGGEDVDKARERRKRKDA